MAGRLTTARIGEIAQEQWGLITRRQLAGAGIPSTTVERLVAEGSVLERVAYGVYRLVGAPIPDHMELRAAWLQLAPDVPAWERDQADGVVSCRAAADVYGIGHLPADQHEFTVQHRHQSRRQDVRIHQRKLERREWVQMDWLPVTRPSRIASDLLHDNEDPESVAQVVADAIRSIFDYPGAFAESLAPHASRFGLRQNDGLALLQWLLELVGDTETKKWMAEARESMALRQPTHAPAPSVKRPPFPVS